MDEKILEYVRTKLEERKDTLVQYLCGGAAKDYAHYKDVCGEIRGLSVAQSEISDLVRKIIKEPEDE